MISIIVPVYNVEKYLHRCIESILNQTYKDLEIILVDDGSPDRCGQICDDYAQKDSRIKVIHKENGGLGLARNSGIAVCSGEYIMFLDSDDYLAVDAVQVLFDRILSDCSDLAVGKHMDVYDDGTTNDWFCAWIKDAVLSPDEVFAKLGEKNYISVIACAKLYKRCLWEDIAFPDHKCSEDLWVHPAIIEKCEKISIVNKNVYYYYQRKDSILHVMSEQAKRDDIRATLKLVAFLWERGFEKSARRWYSIGVAKALKMKNKQEARELFRQYILPEERKSLLSKQTIITKLKWLCIYVPWLHRIIKSVKHLIGRE